MTLRKEHAKTFHLRRVAAGIASAALLLVILFSVFYIAAEAEHDCTDEDCPVCAALRQCENNLRRTGGGAAVPAVFVLFAALSAPASLSYTLLLSHVTPVTRKVRLDN